MKITGRAVGAHPVDLSEARSILVIRPDGIGDVVMTGPFLGELRRASPKATITLIVAPHVSNLVRDCPYVDRVLNFRAQPVTRWWHPLSRRFSVFSFARRSLWLSSYDAAVMPRWGEDLYEGAPLAYLSQASLRAGYSEHTSTTRLRVDRGSDRFLTRVVHDPSVKHEVERNVDFLFALGVSSSTMHADASSHPLEVWLSEEDEQVAREIVSPLGDERLVAIGPGAGGARRMWPIDRFVEVAQWLRGRGYRPVVVGGPGEEGLGRELQAHLGSGTTDLTNRLTLRQTAAVLRWCSVFCGNDAGTMHLAAAAGIPVVEVSCHPLGGDDLDSNSPVRFGPWGVPSRVLRPDGFADGCATGCRQLIPHCILNVRVDSVIAAIESLMNDSALLGGPADAF